MKSPTHYRRALAALQPAAVIAILVFAPVFARAQTLTPMFGAAVGAIGQVAAAQVAQDQFVTAMVNSTGNLEVIAWYANLGANQLVRQGTYVAGPVATWLAGQYPVIAVSAPYFLNDGISGVFTTASVNSSGNLDIIYWQLQSNGNISLVAEAQQTGGATAVSVASLYYSQSGRPQFMTAIRNASGNLQLSLWYLSSSNALLTSGTAYAGGVSAIAMTSLIDYRSDVVTAVVNSSGDLEVIQWFYNNSLLSRGPAAYTSTPGTSVAVAPGVPMPIDPPYFLNEFYTAAANPWTVVQPWNQDLGMQANSVTAGISSQLSMIGNAYAAVTVSTPYSTGGTYSLWVFGQKNNQFTQVTGALGAYATEVGLTWVDTTSASSQIFAVAYRNSLGNLQIQLWNYQPA